ncbi:BTB/POZ domain-containing protein [Tieghemostelium lacteum]|uniref:BTB/POZ domain-containing protein n=1 Tax=Tieghemostelium lacteum TaxID=361077 RepID=A0A151ZFH6_TIELA|nr:BTB/POZ domain-containing protein [Tieghemostelium lacteum]|eukprot:KYQ92723.1 BTB/POZ domain-containing protein [Tieghemostelium lacteum]
MSSPTELYIQSDEKIDILCDREKQNSKSPAGSVNSSRDKTVTTPVATITTKTETELLQQLRHLELNPDNQDSCKPQFQSNSNIVKLNIGGVIHCTSLTTLLSDSTSMFYLMFSGRFSIQKEVDGSIFIDRDGSLFHWILNWMRSKYLPLDLSETIKEHLLQEAIYYQLTSLIEYLQLPSKTPEDINKFTQKEIIQLLNKANSKPIQLASANLSGIDLSGLNLRGANLRFANLEGSNLKYVNLQESNLQGANLKNCDLQHSDLSGSTLVKAQLQNSQLQYATFASANLSDAELTEASLQNADFQNAYLSCANLQGANLQDTNLFGAKIQGTSLYRAVNVQRAKGLKR